MIVKDEIGRTNGTSISKTAGPKKFMEMIRSHKGGSSLKIIAKQAGGIFFRALG